MYLHVRICREILGTHGTRELDLEMFAVVVDLHVGFLGEHEEAPITLPVLPRVVLCNMPVEIGLVVECEVTLRTKRIAPGLVDLVLYGAGECGHRMHTDRHSDDVLNRWEQDPLFNTVTRERRTAIVHQVIHIRVLFHGR